MLVVVHFRFTEKITTYKILPQIFRNIRSVVCFKDHSPGSWLMGATGRNRAFVNMLWIENTTNHMIWHISLTNASMRGSSKLMTPICFDTWATSITFPATVLLCFNSHWSQVTAGSWSWGAGGPQTCFEHMVLRRVGWGRKVMSGLNTTSEHGLWEIEMKINKLSHSPNSVSHLRVQLKVWFLLSFPQICLILICICSVSRPQNRLLCYSENLKRKKEQVHLKWNGATGSPWGHDVWVLGATGCGESVLSNAMHCFKMENLIQTCSVCESVRIFILPWERKQ